MFLGQNDPDHSDFKTYKHTQTYVRPRHIVGNCTIQETNNVTFNLDYTLNGPQI